ncbi:WD repeat-containing protein 19 [Coelomomyces lativittatus]|nr:WD repeat-containing protein 19 [Coelomomyces lativittatus]KAJ1502822.1 WD repeat-containing protein 19 [Coelomomyces lativittatus]
MKRVYVLDKTTLGSGTSPPLFSWQPVFSNYLAVVGAASYALRILDRQGGVVDVINLTSNCSVLRWSPDGNMLAICQSQASTILVWNVKDQTEQMIESSFKIFTCLAWSASSDMIAAGTSKGNLLLATLGGKTIPVLGKHTKSIEHVIWTKQNQIITVSEDKTWVVSNMEGDSIAQFGLKGQPSSPTLYQDKDQKHVFLCLIDKKSIYIHWIHSSSTTPNLLTLPPKYGEVLAIHPIESQQALFLVCTNGLISLISLDPQKLGQELAFSKVFKAGISATSFMNPLAAFTNEGHIKTLDVTDLREVVHKFDVVDTPNVQVDSIAWSADTRFLTMVLR